VRLLVVEDERRLADRVAKGLREEGLAVDCAATLAAARDRAIESDYDLVLLDLGLPDGSGLELLAEWRREGRALPVLLLPARDRVEEKVAGLDAGADDYLAKPFALAELLARLRALLRRAGSDSTDRLRFADLELDPGTREVTRGGDLIELTRTEFSLLELFLRNPRQVLTRSIIFERVWGFDFGPTSNSLDVYIGYLRRKTEAGGKPRLIHTVRGVGYALRES